MKNKKHTKITKRNQKNQRNQKISKLKKYIGGRVFGSKTRALGSIAKGAVGDAASKVGQTIQNMDNPIVSAYQLIEKYIFGWDVINQKSIPPKPLASERIKNLYKEKAALVKNIVKNKIAEKRLEKSGAEAAAKAKKEGKSKEEIYKAREDAIKEKTNKIIDERSTALAKNSYKKLSANERKEFSGDISTMTQEEKNAISKKYIDTQEAKTQAKLQAKTAKEEALKLLSQ
jgi:hypothetical protein